MLYYGLYSILHFCIWFVGRCLFRIIKSLLGRGEVFNPNIKLAMTIKRIVLSVALLLFMMSFGLAQGQSESYSYRLYNSYQLGQMDVWLEVLAQMEKDYSVTPSNEMLFDIAQLQYGYIGYLLGIKNKKLASSVLSDARQKVDMLLSAQPNNANAMALGAALMAYQIAISPYKAPFIGPKSMSIINESLLIDPNAPQALLEKANSAHYAPSMFGGNPVEAIAYYTKAIGVMEELNGGGAPQTWLYLNAYAQLALAQEKAKQLANAKNTYLHILKIAPKFKWVKDELYPKFLKSGK